IQKDAERPDLNRILAALALTPDSEPEAGETPDFIIQLRGQSVGVEITLYRSGEIIDGTVKRRAAESGWDLLKAAAQEFWSQHDDLRAVNVGVTFKGRVPRRGDHHSFIQEVAAFVRQHLAPSLSLPRRRGRATPPLRPGGEASAQKPRGKPVCQPPQ